MTHDRHDDIFERLSASRAAAEAVAEARRGDATDAAVRLSFVDVTYATPERARSHVAPLISSMRTRSPDAVRLRLTVTLRWWLAAIAEFTIAVPSWFIAELIGLSDPRGSGALQVRRGLQTLEDDGQVDLQSAPPAPTRITLLHDDGSGQPYTPPNARSKEPAELFFKVPSQLWTHAWLPVLSNRALASYLIILANLTFDARDEPIWVSGTQLDRYGIDPSTWQGGMRELADWGLVHRETEVKSGGRYQGLNLAGTGESSGLTSRTKIWVDWPTIRNSRPLDREYFRERFDLAPSTGEEPLHDDGRWTDEDPAPF